MRKFGRGRKKKTSLLSYFFLSSSLYSVLEGCDKKGNLKMMLSSAEVDVEEGDVGVIGDGVEGDWESLVEGVAVMLLSLFSFAFSLFSISFSYFLVVVVILFFFSCCFKLILEVVGVGMVLMMFRKVEEWGRVK